MGGPEMAPQTPPRSARPGGAVSRLEIARGDGAPRWPPQSLRSGLWSLRAPAPQALQFSGTRVTALGGIGGSGGAPSDVTESYRSRGAARPAARADRAAGGSAPRPAPGAR